MNSPVDSMWTSDALHGPTSGHSNRFKGSLAETQHTDLTGVESLDDAEIHCRLVEEEPSGFPTRVDTPRLDDDDSLSSLSSDEGRPIQRRPIFAAHWDKSSATRSMKRSGPFPKRKLVTHPCPYSTESDDDVDSQTDHSGNTYERMLKQQEGIKTSSSTVNSDRRSIFAGCITRTEPLLQRAASSCFAMSPQLSALSRRNAFSDSELVVKKPPSCLRSSKYSGTKPVRESPSQSPPVKFAATVKIVKYEIPQEQWAAAGWSSIFH